ncbi:MAG TPA: hypothetical protein VGM88_32345 [Kofleriaceae bacterium]|jgi:hypothetical protein
MKLAALLLPLLVPLTAHADCPSASATQYPFSANPTYLAKCSSFTEAGTGQFSGWNIHQDQTNFAYRPTSAARAQRPAQRLILILHGHPGSPGPFTEFQSYAASLGYFSISLDQDLTDVPGGAWCPGGVASGATCDNRPTAVCGCFGECYGAWNSLINSGVPHAGLAPAPNTNNGVPAYLSVRARAKAALTYLAQHDDASWGDFLDSSGDLKWHMIIGVGHSRGASLIGQLSKNNPMERVLLFGGPDDHTGALNGSDASHVPTYGWGGGATCTPTPDAPDWAHNDGSWETPKIFAFNAVGDPNWFRSYPPNNYDGVERNLAVMGAIAPDLGLFALDVGTALVPLYPTDHSQAFVTDQPCTGSEVDGSDGHGATVLDTDECDTSESQTFRHKIWKRMLTLQ